MINELNRPAVRNFSEKSYLYYTVSYSILSTNIDIVKIFCVLHNKVALLTRDVLKWGTRNPHQRIFRKVLPNHINIENIDEKINFYHSDKNEIRLPFYRSFLTF